MAENERKDTNEEKKTVFNTWVESYMTIAKMWEDSYLKLYKPWFESTGELFEKAIDISRNATPEKHKEFYDKWIEIYQNNYKRVPTFKSNKDILEKLLVSAEESNKLYRSWISELEENSDKTRNALSGDTDPAKYKEVYDMWIRTYGKIFDELLTLPFRENMRDIFESYTGVPDIYSDTFIQISKLWKDSYAQLYSPLIESMTELSDISVEIGKSGGKPETYKEFYDIWIKSYQKIYGEIFDIKSLQSPQISKDVFESFVQNTNIYVNLYKSWITTLEKLSIKAKELEKQEGQDTYKECYNLWARTYEKSVDSFFENIPTIGPFKEIMEPVKKATKIYVGAFLKMSNIWTKSYTGGMSDST